MDNNQVSSRTIVIVFSLIVIAIIIGGVLLYFSRPEPVEITINPPIPTATDSSTATPEPITVYITGAVSEPQSTISLPFGSRVQDAIDLVGGLTDEANLDLVNLAAIVRDGDQIHVPLLSETTVENDDEATDSIALPTQSGGDLVFINTATREELQTLPGIGVAMAQIIVEYRQDNGLFTSLEDLDSVPGIGPSTLEDIADLISFE